MAFLPADGRKRFAVLGGAWALCAVLAFLWLDPVIAAAAVITAAVVAAMVALADDWQSHPTFEQRELDRARRRAAKRERTKGARERDRERWAAYQAKKAGRTESGG